MRACVKFDLVAPTMIVTFSVQTSLSLQVMNDLDLNGYYQRVVFHIVAISCVFFNMVRFISAFTYNVLILSSNYSSRMLYPPKSTNIVTLWSNLKKPRSLFCVFSKDSFVLHPFNFINGFLFWYGIPLKGSTLLW